MTDHDEDLPYPFGGRRTKFCLAYCGDDRCDCGLAEEKLSRTLRWREFESMETVPELTHSQNLRRLRPVAVLIGDFHFVIGEKLAKARMYRITDTNNHYVVASDGQKLFFNPYNSESGYPALTLQVYEEWLLDRGYEHPWKNQIDFEGE